MKQKRRNKTRKLIVRIWISIVILLLLAIGLLVFSEKVHTVGMVDNVKKQVRLLTEQVQNAVSSSNKLVLNTQLNLEAANGKGGVNLDWSTYDESDKIFKAYQKKDDIESSEWESISTFDFYSKDIEPIKVLNVYPESNSKCDIPTVTFKYSDGTSKNLAKSASLKVWMEGGTMNGTSFKAYGINPITGKQIIKVTPVSNSEFNNNPNIIWNYDIVMYGTWDSSGYVFPNANAVKVIEEYIKSGYGVLIGHDTLGYNSSAPELCEMRKLRQYFNIEIGKAVNYVPNECDYNASWMYLSTYVTVNKTGLLTNFPYEIPLGAKLTIPATHSNRQAALGNVWMTLVNGTDNWGKNGSVNNYYNLCGKGNPCYYLTTWNNTAMIQTGHSNCESTDDERKVLANTLFYLKQRTTATSSIDNSSQDLKEPNAPIIIANRISATDNIEINFNAKDNGSTYSFYVEAYDSSNASVKLATSNERTETVITGTKGYYYIIDGDSSNKDFDITAAEVKYTEDTNIILDISNNGKYIHVKAIDAAGNVGNPSVIKLDIEDYTITVDNDREGHTYNSYQVFQGDYYEKEDENGNKIPILSNIEWGKELQKEIVTENEEIQGKTHGDKIIELLKEQNEELYKDCETAEDIARVLQGKENDGTVIREFTDVVGKYILDNNIPLTKGTCTLVEEKDADGNVIETNYKIEHLEPGYYIVIDAQSNEKDDAYSRYLIDVVQNVTMYPKSSIPTIRKKVIGNNVKIQVEGTSEENSAQYVEDEKRNTAIYKAPSENYNAEDYDIEFELKSYIPNPDGYSTYKFEIVDILAKGFDFDRNSVKVMLDNNEYPKTREKEIGSDDSTKDEIGDINKTEIVENYTIRDILITAENYETYKKYFEEEGKEYLEGYEESQYGKTLILVELNDLLEQLEEGIVEKGQDVIVIYKAKLNGKGETGNTPNINEAYLKYSNNPYKTDEITQTTTQTTYTYTIDLNLSKIAELKSEIDEKVYLSGAEFEIYSEPETVKDRTLIATITTDKIVDSEGNIIKESGKAIYSSLGEGTYYLKEIKSPEGYNKLREEIEIEIKAECDEYGTITWSVEEKANNNLLLAQIGVKEGTTIPEIKLQVENTSGFQLPVTGGKGTTFFIVIGISLMSISIIFIKSNKKRIK